MKSLDLVRQLGEYKIFLSTTSACCSKKESTILKEIYNDEKIYKNPIRLSISHLTTINEINDFFRVFDQIYYNKLNSK